MAELTPAESLRLFGEIIRNPNGTVLNPIDVILPRTNGAAGQVVAMVVDPADNQHWVETTVTVDRPEPTPEQLAHTTFYTRDEWWTAYRQLGTRAEWPQMVDWVRRGMYRPSALPDVVAMLEPRPTLAETLAALDAFMDRTPVPSAAWRTTWRDIIVPILAPKEPARLVRPRWKRAGSKWQPFADRKTSYEVTE